MVKGFDLVDRMPEELRTEFQNTLWEAVTKTISKKKKFTHRMSAVRNLPLKKAKWLSEEALQRAEKRSKRQGRKGKIYPTEHRVPENSKER